MRQSTFILYSFICTIIIGVVVSLMPSREDRVKSCIKELSKTNRNESEVFNGCVALHTRQRK